MLDILPRRLRALDDLNSRIAFLFRSTLSRQPTRTELTGFTRHFRGIDRPSDQMEVLEDLYWALLNSGEFGFNH
jgi:hypothetical protein